MFSYEDVKQLNQLELYAYKYIVAHIDDIQNMTIRELSDKSHVSTTTILRFLKKMGFDGYAEFKFALKQRNTQRETRNLDQDWEPVQEFLEQANSLEYVQLLEQAAEVVTSVDTCLLFGLGSSGSLAQYGARILANYGVYTLAISDPFQPRPATNRDYSKTLIIFLSVSGETEEVLAQARYYQENGAKTMAITANSFSPLAQLVDYDLFYDIPEIKTGSLNLTSQIPVVYILEKISSKANEILRSQL